MIAYYHLLELEDIDHFYQKDRDLQQAFWFGYAMGAPKELMKENRDFLDELRGDTPTEFTREELQKAAVEMGKLIHQKLHLTEE